MLFFESASEIAIGIGVETLMLAVAAGVVYRVFSGKFLIPKREIVLPNQRGVVVQGEQIIRIAEPGSCWLRPKQRVILVDMRPRPLQMLALEAIGSDNGIVRLSLSGEYRISDAGTYYTGSSNAGDAIFVQLRRAILPAARQHLSGTIVAAPDAFAKLVRNRLAPEAGKLGLEVVDLQIWEALHVGWLSHSAENPPEQDDSPSTLVH